MSENNEKDNGTDAANTLKDRPTKKPDLHDYKSEDAMDEEKLQDESKSETRNDESLPAGA